MNEEDCGDAQGVSSAFGVASAKGGEQMSGAFRPMMLQKTTSGTKGRAR